MRIGADASYLRWQPSGLRRYSDGLLHSLVDALQPDDELFAYYNAFRGSALFTSPAVVERFVRMPKATAWNQIGVPAAVRRDRCDVYLGCANIVPAHSAVPSVVVVHDCKAFRVPDAEPPGWRRYLQRWQRRSVAAAAHVVSVSQWSAGEATHWLGADPQRTTVVYQGLDPAFFAAPHGGTDLDRDIESRIEGAPFVLQVGGNERHKGGAIAAEAVRHLRRLGRELQLVRCGPPGLGERVDGVVDLGFVSDGDLRSLYRRAVATVVTSLHEGFGLPVVESMACGTPVVTARRCALPEAGGDIAIYAEPADAAGFASELSRLLDDSQELHERSVAGIEWAGRFTWSTAAESILAVLREVAA